MRETFGVLVAEWQASHAKDARVRETMQRVARDEARHAALGWRMLEWTDDMLGHEGKALVREAIAKAVDDLERAAASEPDQAAAETLGLPSAARATALVRALRRELWS